MSPFENAIAKFDAYNSQDPNMETVDGKIVPRELLYAQRMSRCLAWFAPDAAEDVLLAARCQHIGRWQIPRSTYPDGKKGYLQWRNKLKGLHAEIAADIMLGSGYDEMMVGKVGFLLLKKDLQHNTGTQLLEDVVCLVFIEFYLADFAKKHDSAKVVDILRKTIKKMSTSAQAKAMNIPLDENIIALVKQAAR
jgi:hypothetical protein